MNHGMAAQNFAPVNERPVQGLNIHRLSDVGALDVCGRGPLGGRGGTAASAKELAVMKINIPAGAIVANCIGMRLGLLFVAHGLAKELKHKSRWQATQPMW